MSEITVIGAAFTSDPFEYGCLSNTAAKFGVPLRIFGTGKLHPGDAAVFPMLIDELRAASTPYVVLTDTYDTLVCRWDETEIIATIDAQPSGVLISCEASCYPLGEWRSAYNGDSVWKFINGGQSCGRKDELIDLFTEIMKYEDLGGSSQSRWHQMYAAGYPMDLDRECRIFQSMSAPGYGIKWYGETVNTVENTRPMLMHWNGRTPGMEFWYQKVMGG